MILDKLLVVPYILFSASHPERLRVEDEKPYVKVLRACKQLYLEGKPILYRKNFFSFACMWGVPTILLMNRSPGDNVLFSMALKGIRKLGLIIVMYMGNMYYRAKTFMKPLLCWEGYELATLEKLWIRFEGYETWMKEDNPLGETPCDFVTMVTKAPIRVRSILIGGIQDKDVVKRISDVFTKKSQILPQQLIGQLPEEKFRLPQAMIQEGLAQRFLGR